MGATIRVSTNGTTVQLGENTAEASRLAGIATAAAATAVAVAPNMRLPTANLLDEASRNNSLANGAVALIDRRGSYGLRVPTGQSGNNSVLYFSVPIDGAGLAGSVIRLTWQGETSATFTRALALSLYGGAAGATLRSPTEISAVGGVGGLFQWVIDYTVQASDASLVLVAQMLTPGTVASDQTLAITSISWAFVSSAVSGITGNELAQRQREDSIVRLLPQRTLTVKESGGTFTTMDAAFAAIDDSSPSRRYSVELFPHSSGDWPANQIAVPRYVDLKGIGPERVSIKGYQASSTSLALVTANSTLLVQEDCTLRNLKVTAQNMRYAVHADAPSMRQAKISIFDCEFTHLGNLEVIAFRGSSAGVWASDAAWGIGTWDDLELLFDEGCLLRSRSVPLFAHTYNKADYGNVPALAGAKMTVRNSKLENTSAGAAGGALNLQSFDSGRRHLCIVEGVTFIGTTNHSVQVGTAIEWFVSGFAPSGFNPQAGVQHQVTP